MCVCVCVCVHTLRLSMFVCVYTHKHSPQMIDQTHQYLNKAEDTHTHTHTHTHTLTCLWWPCSQLSLSCVLWREMPVWACGLDEVSCLEGKWTKKFVLPFLQFLWCPSQTCPGGALGNGGRWAGGVGKQLVFQNCSSKQLVFHNTHR